MKRKKLFVSFDVEASGQVSGLFDAISVGLVVIEPGLARRFYGEFAPEHEAYQQGAYGSIGITREQHLAMPKAQTTTMEMLRWTDSLDADRIVLISDNPAFDFQFVSWLSWRFGKRSPFGHSARRIGDFYAGLKGNFLESQGWKKLRVTRHTHNALDDAVGNAEALMAVIDQFNLKPIW